MDKSVRLSRVPGELDYLALERPSISSVQSTREVDPWTPSYGMSPSLTPTASQRLRKLVHAELQDDELSVAHPVWLTGQAVPRLIVTAKYTGQDAFGSSRLLADLDLAARRAGALQRQLLRSAEIEKWPAPLRTYQGGLRLLDARMGSFDVLLTAWGSLVTIAGSSPVAVASLMALAWDVGRGTLRLANRWVGAALPEGQQDQPSLDVPDAAEPWGLQHTKTLAPVMRDVVANGQGFELFLNEKERKIKLTVPPKERADSGDRS